jgi:hypothetical protein
VPGSKARVLERLHELGWEDVAKVCGLGRFDVCLQPVVLLLDADADLRKTV